MSQCNHTTKQTCLRGDECAQCLREEITRLQRERDALQIEYESRADWIDKMNKILGYDNGDPFELAKRLQRDRERLDWLDKQTSVVAYFNATKVMDSMKVGERCIPVRAAIDDAQSFSP